MFCWLDRSIVDLLSFLLLLLLYQGKWICTATTESREVINAIRNQWCKSSQLVAGNQTVGKGNGHSMDSQYYCQYCDDPK